MSPVAPAASLQETVRARAMVALTRLGHPGPLEQQYRELLDYEQEVSRALTEHLNVERSLGIGFWASPMSGTLMPPTSALGEVASSVVALTLEQEMRRGVPVLNMLRVPFGRRALWTPAIVSGIDWMRTKVLATEDASRVCESAPRQNQSQSPAR